MRRSLFWLNDEQWDRIEPYLPTDIRGVERAGDRRVISGIVHVLKSGCRWCDCPPEYGRPRSITGLFAGQAALLTGRLQVIGSYGPTTQPGRTKSLMMDILKQIQSRRPS